MNQQPCLFPDSPTITFHDPLGELLGAGDGNYHYRFDDAVKLAGHACPTVAGAFVMMLRAVEELYHGETPQRGDIRIDVYGSPDKGSTGPFTQVLTLLSGAAAENGFQGLNGKFVRQGLMHFTKEQQEGPVTVIFTRLSNNTQVKLAYDPSAIAAEPTMMELMKVILAGKADATTRQQFTTLWRGRVDRIVADRGTSTINRLN
jgi:hypothetical protein